MLTDRMKDSQLPNKVGKKKNWQFLTLLKEIENATFQIDLASCKTGLQMTNELREQMPDKHTALFVPRARPHAFVKSRQRCHNR